uniref:DOD-type homing endonuclease domain-containing protein n=1 Tax=Marseillevirus LCMAC201 TaxID=2506605 RepID=A0A481YWE8_9VIRU|nr:MAG: hypothetical protein LCMAC201_04180 [Marseillevirus LCMAC201]
MSYFSSDTQVLLADGSYKNITLIKPDDYVLNMRNEAVKVIKVHTAPKVNMMELRYQNWYTPFYCTLSTQFLVTVEPLQELSETKWLTGSDLQKDMCLTSESNLYYSILPKDFELALDTPMRILLLRSSYNLGLIFGLYAGYGSIIDDQIEFRFGPNEELIDQIAELLNELDADTVVVKDNYCYQVKCSSAHIVELFSEFGTKINRTIPKKYWSSDKEYVRGLYEGLIEFDPINNISRYIPVDKEMAEVFLWVCSLLGATFENDTPRIDQRVMQVYPLFVKDDQDDSYLGKITHVDVNSNVTLSQWNLEVACPTNSIIVNNLVVRSVMRGCAPADDAGLLPEAGLGTSGEAARSKSLAE